MKPLMVVDGDEIPYRVSVPVCFWLSVHSSSLVLGISFPCNFTVNDLRKACTVLAF